MSTDAPSKVRTKEEHVLARNLKFLEETQRLSRIGSWEVCFVSNIVSWSDFTRTIYEVESNYEPSYEGLMSFVKNDRDKERLTGLIEKTRKEGGTFDTEIEITTALNNDRWIRITGNSESTDEHFDWIYGAIQDITEKKRTEKSLEHSQHQLQSVVQSVKGIFWEADATTFIFSFVSDHVKEMLGFTPQEWLSEPNFWENHIHPSDRKQAVGFCQFQVNNFRDHTFDYRMITADERIIWVKDVVSVIKEEGKPTCLRGLMVDITETKRIEELGKLEKSVLELNAANDSALDDVLVMYLTGMEEIFPMMQCSLHRVKENRLEYGIAPSLPIAYLDALRNVSIGPLVGSCGTAAFLKQTVIVSDIENDPKWAEYYELALKNNLLACWSKPIMDSDGVVMATLAFYYGKVKSPEEEELAVIERCVAILKIILENRQKSILLKESSMVMKQAQELAAFGNWQWDIINNTVTWSDELYTIFGLEKSEFGATFEGYQELVHHSDRAPVREIILEALQTKTDVTYEERIIRPDGKIRYLKTWSRIERDEKGNAIKMTGACLDVTESRHVQEQLAASESRLRSIADAQTNYVMRIDLTGRYTYYNNKYYEDFGWIFENREILGENSSTTIVPEHHQRAMETGLKCFDNPNQVFQVELDKLAPNGSHRSTFWHFICLTDQNGAPFEIQCIGVDMSEKKKIEDALKRSNERYQYVNKATNDATYDWNTKTDHIRWGEGFTRLFGFELNEEPTYPLKKWKNNVHPADRERLMESLSSALNDISESRWQSAYQFQKKDGSYAYVQENSYILRDLQGKAVRMIGVLRDMTRQKEEEHRLKLLESVITHANDLVIIAAADPLNLIGLSILYINEAFTKITGYESSEVIGQSKFIPNGLNSGDTANLILAIKSGLPAQFETILSKKNGDEFWISLSLNPIEDEKGNITHWVSIGRDITDRRRYTEAIEHQNEKLRNIAWMQSHVVRAPLARLMGAIDLIKNYPNSETENKEILTHILGSANELDGIIREISEKTQSDPWLFMK